MTVNTSEQTSLDLLITLKSQYEYALTEANAKAVYLREQLAHVNALLINQLIPSNGAQPLQASVTDLAPMLALSAQNETLNGDFSDQLSSLEVAEPLSVSINAAAVTPRNPKRTISKVTPKPEKAAHKQRNSLPLLPAYQGLQKLDAIAQVLRAAAGREVTIDSVVQTLYGNLSAAEHKAERLRMKTAMFQGVKKEFWQKAATPSSYFIPAVKGRSSGRKAVKASLVAKAEEAVSLASQSKLARVSKTKPGPVAGANKRNSLPLLPVYQDMKKLDAIGVVLENYRGEVLHHDTIIQMLYGDLSPAELKAERVRIKTALLTGVRNNRWEKAPKPSSYFLKPDVAKSSGKTRGVKSPKK